MSFDWMLNKAKNLATYFAGEVRRFIVADESTITLQPMISYEVTLFKNHEYSERLRLEGECDALGFMEFERTFSLPRDIAVVKIVVDPLCRVEHLLDLSMADSDLGLIVSIGWVSENHALKCFLETYLLEFGKDSMRLFSFPSEPVDR